MVLPDVFSGPQGATFAAALVAAFIVAAFNLFNPKPKPIPKWRLWANRAAVAALVVLVILYGRV